MVQLSTSELAEEYATSEIRTKLLRLYSLTHLLSQCAIDGKYRIPDGLHTPIVLTKYGERIADRLRKQGVQFPESRVLCLLEMLGPQPLVDVDGTDIDAIERSISTQVKNREFLYPLIYGRTLYDKFSGAYTEEKMSLSAKETWEFLAATPQGVFQAGNAIVGPFGVIRASTWRNLMPTLTIPLQHCADPGCGAAHRVALSTDYDAPINEHRVKIAKLLERDGLRVDAWFSFFDTFAIRPMRRGLATGEAIITLIGDALTDSELRQLISWLLDNTEGRLRSIATEVGVRGEANRAAADLDRAQLLQLACSCSNTDLSLAIDSLVATRQIDVPSGETRTAVVNRGSSFGPYGLVAEINPLGLRVRATRSAIAPLRMRQLIERMYNLQQESDRAELAWQLRARVDESVERRLDRHLQDEEPKETLTRLTLARRSNVVIASEYLQIKINENEPLDDARFIETVQWKLGFPVASFPDLNKKLFDLHDKIMLLIRQISPGSFEQLLPDLRGLGSNYFVALEEVLRDSLSFSAWALTSDHYTSSEPFVYRDDRDGIPAFLSLNQASSNDPPEYRVDFTETPSMYSLCRGFERLAVILDMITAETDGHLRPDSDKPQWTRDPDTLQSFPFAHTAVYLDLTDGARQHISKTLREASQVLVGADVPDIRNKIMHPRFSLADIEALKASLTAVQETLLHLEADGFCRLTYMMSSYEGDSTWREKTTLAHPRGYKYSLYSPSSYSWLRMPSDSTPQYIMPAATIAGDVEVLRFTRKVYSPYADMYDRYPIRPAGPNRSEVGHASHSVR